MQGPGPSLFFTVVAPLIAVVHVGTGVRQQIETPGKEIDTSCKSIGNGRTISPQAAPAACKLDEEAFGGSPWPS